MAYERLVKGLAMEAVRLRMKIEKCRNPFRKHKLLEKYAELINLLALKCVEWKS